MIKKIPESVMKAKVIFDSLMNVKEIKIREQLLQDMYVLGKTICDTIMDLEMKSALTSFLILDTCQPVTMFKVMRDLR